MKVYQKKGILACYLSTIVCASCFPPFIYAEVQPFLTETPIPQVPDSLQSDTDTTLGSNDNMISGGWCPEHSTSICEESLMNQLGTEVKCWCEENGSEHQCSYTVIGRITRIDQDREQYDSKSMVSWTPASGGNNFEISSLSCLEQAATDCMNPEMLMYSDSSWLKINPNDPKHRIGPDDCIVNSLNGRGLGVNLEDPKYKSTLALDANCNPVPAAKVKDEICGTLDLSYIITPVSLVFGPLTFESLPSTLVKFPLEPYKKGLLYTWKASADLPLLVYDPEKSGIIADATQLFGNWTFGGKRFSSLTEDAPNTGGTSAWQHGFEALESLDENFDGKLEAEELAPLSLWFDNNRDGISQPGEVQTVKDRGILRLYYQPDVRDVKTGDLYATRGYEQLVEGKLIKGAAVDWFSSSSTSSIEAMTKLQLQILSD